jgi:hypothetical protein
LKNCCKNCFKDFGLWSYIKKHGDLGRCDYCRQNNEDCIDLDAELFVKMFALIKKMYVVMPVGRSRSLFSFIQGDWEVFSRATSQIYLFEDLCKIHGIDYEDYYIENPDFNYYNFVWHDYKDTVKHKNRFINSLPVEIENLLSSLDNRYKCLSKENMLYRARIGRQDDLIATPYPPSEMGMPPANKSRAGRANPDGIPYLYLAGSKETAIAEVRPWSGCLVTIATIRLLESLNTINFSVFSHKSLMDYLAMDNVDEALSELQFFNYLSLEMSKPVSPNDSYLEYIPTQYLTEYIKNEGYDGIIYDSSLSPGQNLVLFEQNNIEITSTELFRIGQIKYDFDDAF